MELTQIRDDSTLYIRGLVTAVASNTTLTLGTGQCRDSLNDLDLFVDSVLTINAAVVGKNGIDTGALAASTQYYIYEIDDNTHQYAAAGLASTSATAPVLPQGYNTVRLVGYVRTDSSSHFLPFIMSGVANVRTITYYDEISVLAGGTQVTTFANVSLAAALPPVDKTPVTLTARFTPTTAGDYVEVRPYGTTGTNSASLSSVVAAQVQRSQISTVSMLNSTTPTVIYRNSAASCATTLLVRDFTVTL